MTRMLVRAASVCAIVAGCGVEAFVPGGRTALAPPPRLRSTAAVSGRTAPWRGAALRMSQDLNDDVIRRVNVRLESEPVGLVMAYFEYAYMSESAEIPADALESALAKDADCPYDFSSTLEAAAGVDGEEQFSIHEEEEDVSEVQNNIVSANTLPTTSPTLSELTSSAATAPQDGSNGEVNAVLARVRELEAQHGMSAMQAQKKKEKWSREHSLTSCCQWERKHVSEAIIKEIFMRDQEPPSNAQ